MMRKTYAVGALSAVVVLGGVVSGERTASACGGCFVPLPPPNETQTESVITDEQMILSISMGQTTLYDQINYSGAPASFAWVLPIKGTVTVGLSADILFQTINQLTTTQITSPPENCPAPPSCGGGGVGCAGSSGFSATTSGFATGAGGYADDDGGVTVTSQKQVGPYETVQLHSDDGSALNGWLTQHGYNIPASTKPVIDAYVSQHFDFLALKLVPGEGVQSMQPVRVTSQGAAPSLPLHMVAVGTGPTTGITIWVIADGRWQPSNFPTFTIKDADLAWDWATASSNYETLRLAKEAELGGRGWQVESSLELSQYTITQTLTSNAEYDPTGGYDLALSAASTGDAGVDADGEAPEADAGEVDAAGDFDATEPPDEDGGGTQVDAATADLAVLLSGIAQPNVRITRMRSDIAKSALSVDMILEASSDQSELSNLHTAEQEIGEPLCPVYNSSCVQTATLPRSQAQAATASSGCSTTPRDDSGTLLSMLLGLVGVMAFRMRRRRHALS